jgi:hypothetical protein
MTATKLSPSSVGSNGQVLSVDGSGNLQWGNDANAPEGTAVLSTGESGTTKYLRVDGDGTCSWQLAVDATKTTLTGSTNNTICTVTGANAIKGNSDLLWNGSRLDIDTGGTEDALRIGNTAGADTAIRLGSIGTDPDTHAVIKYDKDDNYLSLLVSGEAHGAGGILIANGGYVGINTPSPSSHLHVRGSGNDTILLVESTDADASTGPIIELFRNSSSPADNDALGRIDFKGEDDAGNASTFARIAVTALDVTNNTEDARLDFTAVTNDTFDPTMSITGGNVGIGTTSPSSNLEVTSGTTSTVYINAATHDASTANEAVLKFGYNQSHATLDSIGYIKLIENGTNAFDGELAFGVPYNNSGTPTTREALRLKWNGRLVLNKTTVTNTHDALTVTHPAGSNAVVSLTVDANNHTGTHANALIYTKSKNTYWAGYAFQSSHGYIGSLLGKRDSDGTTDQEIRMEIGGDGPNDNEEKTWTFRNSGNLALSAGNIEFASGYGIDFSADGNAGGMTSELLHDYEEGTWTMVMTNLGDHTKHGDSRGGYTRVGNKVTAYFFYKWTGRSTTNGAYSVSLDLPFTSMDVKGVGHGSLGLESIRASTSTRTSYHSSVTQNQAKILFRASGDNVGEVSLDGSISTSASAGYLFGMVCYQVA